MFEDWSDKEVLRRLQDTESQIKQLKKDLVNLREENEKRKTIALGKPLDISGVGRFTASVRCNDNSPRGCYGSNEQDVCTFYSFESAKEFCKFLIHLSGALKSNFYGRPMDPKAIALLFPQGSFIAQDKNGLWCWFATKPRLLIDDPEPHWEISDGNWSFLPCNLITAKDWKCSLIECGLPNGTKEFPSQTVEMGEIGDLRTCLSIIANNLMRKNEEFTYDKILQMTKEALGYE